MADKHIHASLGIAHTRARDARFLVLVLRLRVSCVDIRVFGRLLRRRVLSVHRVQQHEQVREGFNLWKRLLRRGGGRGGLRRRRRRRRVFVLLGGIQRAESSANPLTHSFVRSYVRSFVRSFVRSSNCFIRSGVSASYCALV